MRAPSSLRDSRGLEYLQELSGGSFGALWLARRLSGSEIGRLVVARRFQPNQFDAGNVDRVLAAAQRYSSLSHPQLVKNFGGERTESDVVLLEEHLIGVPLGKLHQLALAGQSSLPAGVGVKLVLDALRAADALRRTCLNQGLALPGRTIFPDSVMVANFGEALLSGVGVTEQLCRCRRIREHPDLVEVLDPSAADGANSTDERVEVFTAGALLWKLLLIRGLFNDYGNQQTLSLVLHSNVLMAEYDERLNLCVPKPVANVIRRATQPNLALRYPSLQEMIHAIEALPAPLVASDAQVRAWLEGIAGDYLSDVQHSSGVRPIPSSLQANRLPAGVARRPSFFPTLPGFAPDGPDLATFQPVVSADKPDNPAIVTNTSHPVNSNEGAARRTSRRPDRKAYVVGALLGIVASLGLTYLVGWMSARPAVASRGARPKAQQIPLVPGSTARQMPAPAAPAAAELTADEAGPAQRSSATQDGSGRAKSPLTSDPRRDPKPLETRQPERANRVQSPANARPAATTSANRWGI